MKVKRGVMTEGARPETWFAAGVTEAIFRQFGYVAVITSMLDSHADKPESLHNKGLAVDFRTRHIFAVAIRVQIASAVKQILDPMGYDVILETNPPHLHLEFDPKVGEAWIQPVD